MPRLGEHEVFLATAIALNSTGDKATFSPCGPIKVIRFGVLNTATLDNTPNALVLDLDRRVTAGSDTGRVRVARMTESTTDRAAGVMIWGEIDNAVGEILVLNDEQLVLEVSTAASGGTGAVLFLEYERLPWDSPDGMDSTNTLEINLTA